MYCTSTYSTLPPSHAGFFITYSKGKRSTREGGKRVKFFSLDVFTLLLKFFFFPPYVCIWYSYKDIC